ncbi:MAG: hypothetical protein JXA46_18180 [Dehalococcoidales bacterium]|nr:hypothetical protein [Dehalococcoidales bacterium]
MNKTPAELYNERLNRINDAIQLKVPDRIPTFVHFGLEAARYIGMNFEEAHYDCEKILMASKKIIKDFQPDVFGSFPFSSGAAYEAVDTKTMKWPGHGLPSDSNIQYVEGEYLKADEYDLFFEDPTDFAIRTYLPRTAGSFTAFGKLPPLRDVMHFGRAAGPMNAFLDPEIIAACESVHKAAKEVQKWNTAWKDYIDEMEALGFPAVYRMGPLSPFDYLSDFLRGMRGTMLDMYRQPDKLIEAVEKLAPVLQRSIAFQTRGGTNMVGMALHRGADGFMSLKQFEKFYWPGVKSIVLATIDAGFIPSMFWEGDITSRLEFLLELPEGKVLHRFDRTDIARAKAVLGGHQCFGGGVPPSLLQTGSVQDVREFCKKLIGIAGKDGGFVMMTSSSMEDARLENIKAMIDATREYGRYV